MADRSSWATRARRVGSWLVHPRWPWIVAAVAFVLVLPSLPLGHMVDDLMHAHALRGGEVPGGPRGIWDMYRFADGGEGLARGVAKGMFPWWSSPSLKFAFFRPLSSVLIALDHQVLGDVPWLSHLLSCGAYAALALLVALLLRRLVPGAAGGLAALLYAVDDAHHFPVLWIANRHAILSGALGVAALLAHLRWREGRGRAWTGPLLMLLSLAAGESALTVVPYVLAWAWWMDPAGRRAALRALAPWGAVIALWAAGYVAGGYGASGSEVYLDPLGQPGRFLAGLATRLPQLLLAQLFLPPADVAPLIPPERAVVAAVVGLALLTAVVVPLHRLTRAHPAHRVLAAGMVLSLVPACAVFPSDRLLVLSGVGAFGLVAIALVEVGRRWLARDASRSAVAFAAVMTAVHLVLATLLMPVRIASTGAVFTAGIARGAATVPHDPGVVGKTLVVLVAPDALMTSYMFLDHLAAGRPAPDRARVLAVAQKGAVTALREGEQSLVLRGSEALNVDVFSRLFRADRYAAGERIEAGDMTVEVLAVDAAGFPIEVRYVFDRALDPAHQRWITWRGRGFVELPILAVGESVVLPATDWMTAMAP